MEENFENVQAQPVTEAAEAAQPVSDPAAEAVENSTVETPVAQPVEEFAAQSAETPAAEAAQQPMIDGKPISAMMRSCYNRTGFGVLAGMKLAGAVGVIGLYVAAILVVINSGIVQKLLSEGITSISGILIDSSSLLESLKSGHGVLIILAAYVIAQAIGMGIGILILRLIVKRGACGERIEKHSIPFGQYMLILLAAFGLWGVGALLGNLGIFSGYDSDMLSQYFTMFGSDMLPYFIYAIVGAPILEELMFRKVLLDAAHGYGEVAAMTVSALMFGLAHGNSGQFGLAFLLGLLFAAVYQKTGRIHYTMILHAIINFTASIPSILALYGLETQTVDTVWLIAVHVLIVAGLVIMGIYGKRFIGGLTRTRDVDPRVNAKRTMFKPAGMKLYIILYMVQLIGMDLMSIVTAATAAGGFVPGLLLYVVSTVLTILVVALLPICFRKRKAAAAAAAVVSD